MIFVNFILPSDYNEPYKNYKINKNYYPEKILSNQIILDGKLDEIIWANLKKIEGLEQAEPTINGVPSEITEAKICYDDSYLYIGVYLEHSSNKIIYKQNNSHYWC